MRNNVRRRLNDRNSTLNNRLRYNNGVRPQLNTAVNRRNQLYERRINRINRRERLTNNRVNYYFRRALQPIRNDRNVVRKVKKINDKITELTDDINKISLKENKVNNKFQSKKEMRKDVLTNAMNMTKYSEKIPFILTASPTIKVSYYMKTSFVQGGQAMYYLWFPYNYPAPPYGVNITYNSQSLPTNHFTQFISYNPITQQIFGIPGTNIEIIGNHRLIAATLRISNVTPIVNRGGSYSLYRVTDQRLGPIAYNGADSPNVNTIQGGYIDQVKELCNGPLDSLPTKMTFTASDIGLINEYNVHEGSNIMDGVNEYLSTRYSSINSLAYPLDDNQINVLGTNNFYIIHFPRITAEQAYLIELWQVWDVIPREQSGIGMLAQKDKECFSPEVFKMAVDSFPFHKDN